MKSGQVNRIRYRSRRKKKGIMKRCGGVCIYCGAKENLTIEHLTPISRGGRYDNRNLAISCLQHNLDKGSMTHEEYMKKKFPLRYYFGLDRTRELMSVA